MPIKRGSTDVSFRVGGNAVSKIQRGASEMYGNYLLDLYGGAAAAYSLRRLRSAYAGAVVRVRRSSDNAEADFTADDVSGGTLASWVGAGNNGFVKTWYDQAGSGADISNSTAASQPQVVASGALVTQNGKPGVNFGLTSGTAPVQLTGTLTSANSNWTAFGVVHYGQPPIGLRWEYGRWISISKPSVNDFNTTASFLAFVTNQLAFGEAVPSAQTGYNNKFAGRVLSFNTQYILASYKSGSSVTVRVNNVDGETVTQVGTLDASRICLGANVLWSEANSNFFGVIHEVIYYQTDRSADLTKIDTLLNNYYKTY